MSDFTIKTKEGSQGLYSNKYFDVGQIVLRFDGMPIIKQELNYFPADEQINLLQIGYNIYLNLKDHNSYFIRHNCNPNCIVKITTNKAFLVAIKPIQSYDELTFDYSTTSDEDKTTFSMPCDCSQFYCRKLISGYHSMPNDKKDYYDNLGGIPKYVKSKTNDY